MKHSHLQFASSTFKRYSNWRTKVLSHEQGLDTSLWNERRLPPSPTKREGRDNCVLHQLNESKVVCSPHISILNHPFFTAKRKRERERIGNTGCRLDQTTAAKDVINQHQLATHHYLMALGMNWTFQSRRAKYRYAIVTIRWTARQPPVYSLERILKLIGQRWISERHRDVKRLM